MGAGSGVWGGSSGAGRASAEGVDGASPTAFPSAELGGWRLPAFSGNDRLGLLLSAARHLARPSGSACHAELLIGGRRQIALGPQHC